MSRLRKVDRYFVIAQQLAFPHAKKRVAGPFEENSEAWAEKARLALAKEYPGCNLTAERRSVPIEKSHPKESAA